MICSTSGTKQGSCSCLTAQEVGAHFPQRTDRPPWWGRRPVRVPTAQPATSPHI
jgi:hypothetical protein